MTLLTFDPTTQHCIEINNRSEFCLNFSLLQLTASFFEKYILLSIQNLIFMQTTVKKYLCTFK